MGGCQGGKSGAKGPIEPSAPVQLTKRIDRATLASGLVIEDMERGEGDLCLPGDHVTVRYSCRTEGGPVFDGTGPEPETFALIEMIRGWQEGVPGMQVGGRRRLIVPPELGYGVRALKDASGKTLAPPLSVLVYEIELTGVSRNSASARMQAGVGVGSESAAPDSEQDAGE